MSFKETRLGKLDIKLTGAAPKAITVPDHLFDLPGVWAMVGKRGSGKTTALCSLLRDYKAAGYLDRMFVMSPTIGSRINRDIFKGLIQEEDCYTDLTFENLQKVLDEVEMEGKEWREYELKLACYNKIMPCLRRQSMFGWDNVPQKLLIEADKLGLLDGADIEKPTHKYGHSPRLFLLFDDCQGSKIMSPSTRNPMNNLCIQNRHVGDGCGLTIIFAMQNYSCNSGGLPRFVRENATMYALWRMASEQRRLQLAEELGNDIDMKLFLQAYDHITTDADSHCFMTLDMLAKKEKRFRRFWDTVVEVRPQQAPKKSVPVSDKSDDTDP